MHASSSRVAKALQAASCTRLLLSKILFNNSDISGFRYCSWGCWQTQCAYLDRVQQVMLLTRAFLSLKQLMRYGTSSLRWGTIPDMQPSAIAPNARMPDSFTSHSAWKRVSLRIGSSTGKSSTRKTFARTSSAAAEHFLRFQSERLFSSSIPSSSSSSSPSPVFVAWWERER